MASITTVEKTILSGSTNGKRILVAATATPGTLIHTATNTSGVLDWVYLYVHNSHTSDLELVLEWGEATDPGVIKDTIHTKAGDALVIAGHPLRGGLTVRAFCTTTNKLSVGGYIERATTE